MFFDSDTQEYEELTWEELNITEESIEDIKFYECTFIKCDFSETVFSSCSFHHCCFENCNLSLIQVRNCTFHETSFHDSKMVGINWADMSESKIKIGIPFHFYGCTLNLSNFSGLRMSDVCITDCIAGDVDFTGCDLTKSILSYTDFKKSIFLGTDLSGADLTNAMNYAIDVTKNQLKKAKFSLPEAISLLYSLNIIIEDD